MWSYEVKLIQLERLMQPATAALIFQGFSTLEQESSTNIHSWVLSTHSPMFLLLVYSNDPNCITLICLNNMNEAGATSWWKRIKKRFLEDYVQNFKTMNSLPYTLNPSSTFSLSLFRVSPPLPCHLIAWGCGSFSANSLRYRQHILVEPPTDRINTSYFRNTCS